MPLQQIRRGKWMLCGLFDGVCSRRALVSDLDIGPRRGMITEEFGLALITGLSAEGEGLKRHVTRKTSHTHLQKENGLL